MRRALIISMLAVTALSGCTAMPASERMARSVDSRVAPAVAQPAVVQALQRQVRERDRRIAELTFQLEALKKIEQETESRRQQGRLPVSQDR
jgi:TolA-binding protein